MGCGNGSTLGAEGGTTLSIDGSTQDHAADSDGSGEGDAAAMVSGPFPDPRTPERCAAGPNSPKSLGDRRGSNPRHLCGWLTLWRPQGPSLRAGNTTPFLDPGTACRCRPRAPALGAVRAAGAATALLATPGCAFALDRMGAHTLPNDRQKAPGRPRQGVGDERHRRVGGSPALLEAHVRQADRASAPHPRAARLTARPASRTPRQHGARVAQRCALSYGVDAAPVIAQLRHRTARRRAIAVRRTSRARRAPTGRMAAPTRTATAVTAAGYAARITLRGAPSQGFDATPLIPCPRHRTTLRRAVAVRGARRARRDITRTASAAT
jgi:hypothetical protein